MYEEQLRIQRRAVSARRLVCIHKARNSAESACVLQTTILLYTIPAFGYLSYLHLPSLATHHQDTLEFVVDEGGAPMPADVDP